MKMHKVKGKKKRKKLKQANKKNHPLEPCHAMRLGPGLIFPLANSDYDCTMIVTEARLPGEVQ